MNSKLNQKIKGETFLVTGGAGFIGSHLTEFLLTHGAKKVRVLDNLSTGFIHNMNSFLTHPAFEFMEGDIRDLETCRKACQGVNYVSHQAALGSVPRSLEDPVTTNEVNISGFLNMLIASRDARVQRFVYAASSSTYGDSPELPKVENRIGQPLSPYAVTKLVNEHYAQVFHRHFNLPVIGLRYFNVFGPRQDANGAYAAVIPLFIRAVLNNEAPFINGDGEQTRDFTYIDNVVMANVCSLFADKEAFNEVYNIAVGENISINQLFNYLCEIAGKQITPVYREARKGDVRDSLADISKARRLLHYHPDVRNKEGLRLTFEWFAHKR